MDPIIAISFVNKEIRLTATNKELIPLFKNTRLFLRPLDFKNLKELVEHTFKPKNKESTNLYLKYFGFLPSGEKVEIKDDKTFKKDISIFLAGYIKKKFDIFDDPMIGEPPEEEKIDLDAPEAEPLNINNYLSSKDLAKSFSLDLNKCQSSLLDNLNQNLNDALHNSIEDLILKSSKEKIDNNISSFKRTFSNFTEKIFKSKKRAINIIQKNNQQLKDIDEKIKKYINQGPKHTPKLISEEEPIIFKFNNNPIQLEKDLYDKDKKILIKNVEIKNISSKNYNSSLMSWLKEGNSNPDINFYPGKSSNECSFESDEIIEGNKNLKYESLNLIIDNPKEDFNYKMFISIINKNSKKKISENPLEIVVKMIKGEKILNEEEINNILKILKDEMKDLHLFLNDKEVTQIIINKKGEVNEIKQLIKEKYENLKQKKLDDLFNELEQEFHFSNDLTKNEVQDKIISLNFNIDEIKNYIRNKISKPQPNPQPQPQPNPQPHPQPQPMDNRIKEILDKLEDEYYVSGFLNQNEITEKIINLNFDYEKIVEWVQEKM